MCLACSWSPSGDPVQLCEDCREVRFGVKMVNFVKNGILSRKVVEKQYPHLSHVLKEVLDEGKRFA